MTVVLDTWALIAHLRDEPAAERVREAWIAEGAAICSLNLGEALYLEMRARNLEGGGETIEAARRELRVIDPDWQLVRDAAAIKSFAGLSYADAFCVATAERLGAALMSGDPEIIERIGERSCEVIDLRR
ncbi:MAG: type II toxin-antitoxin system VapC family toxin [Solirubrobacterales bacterium]